MTRLSLNVNVFLYVEDDEVGAGDERRFEFVLAYDRPAVIRAAASLMSRVGGDRANTASVAGADAADAADAA